MWGGGGNFYGRRQDLSIVPHHGRANLKPHASISILTASSEEKDYFEWFQCRTAKKLPGSFISTFWDTLLLQATMNGPAVLHAVLTLSSVHKGPSLDERSRGQKDESPDENPDEQEKFMLQQYSKAIINLRPHFSRNDSLSVRIALITCVVARNPPWTLQNGSNPPRKWIDGLERDARDIRCVWSRSGSS